MVGDEGVAVLGVDAGLQAGHAAVHVEPQRDVQAPLDRGLDVHHLGQQEAGGRPLLPPVL